MKRDKKETVVMKRFIVIGLLGLCVNGHENGHVTSGQNGIKDGQGLRVKNHSKSFNPMNHPNLEAINTDLDHFDMISCSTIDTIIPILNQAHFEGFFTKGVPMNLKDNLEDNLKDNDKEKSGEEGGNSKRQKPTSQNPNDIHLDTLDGLGHDDMDGQTGPGLITHVQNGKGIHHVNQRSQRGHVNQRSQRTKDVDQNRKAQNGKEPNHTGIQQDMTGDIQPDMIGHIDSVEEGAALDVRKDHVNLNDQMDQMDQMPSAKPVQRRPQHRPQTPEKKDSVKDGKGGHGKVAYINHAVNRSNGSRTKRY